MTFANFARALTITAGAILTVPAARAAEPHVDAYVRLTPENSAIGSFPADKAPVITVKSGAVVKIDTGGGASWRNDDPDTWLAAQHIPTTIETNAALAETIRVQKETPHTRNGHLLVGPVAVENAMPGDMLEVRILSVVPRIPYGVVSTAPGRGGIPDDVKQSAFKVVMFDLKRNVGVFDNGIEVPLGPFMGVMAVQPPESMGANPSSNPPGLFGGNLDCRELVKGATLYLPVYAEGARFFTGDAHGGQGDGEVATTAMETANTVTLQFILHKNTKIEGPRAETPTHWIAFGLDPDLNEAMKKAIRATDAFLDERLGIDFPRALLLSSIGVDFHVTQVVDDTKGIHAMIPKSIFRTHTEKYWYSEKTR